MGASTFQTTAKGKSAQEAFESAVEFARDHYGNRMYTGSIKEKEGYGFRKIKVPSNKDINDCIEEKLNNGEFNKHEPCGCIVLKEPKIDNNPKVKVDNHTKKGRKKWKTIYKIKPRFPQLNNNNNIYKERKTKTQAIKLAKKLAKKHEITLQIDIDKKLTSHNTLEAVIEPKSSETELGEYRFFGWASY